MARPSGWSFHGSMDSTGASLCSWSAYEHSLFFFFKQKTAYEMYRPSISSLAQDEATAASGIFRIVLYDFAFLNDFPSVRGGNHSIRPGHLAYRVRQEEYLLRCSLPNQLPAFHVVVVPQVCVIFYVERFAVPRPPQTQQETWRAVPGGGTSRLGVLFLVLIGTVDLAFPELSLVVPIVDARVGIVVPDQPPARIVARYVSQLLFLCAFCGFQ